MKRKIVLSILLVMGLFMFITSCGQEKETFIQDDRGEDEENEPEPEDPRREKIRSYFEGYDCPLAGYTELLIKVADDNGLDWRLLPAIAMAESTGGKFQRYNNPFGYGYYKFSSFEDAILFVGRAISGNNPNEGAFHNTRGDTEVILWIYNGAVNSEYPNNVMKIMEEIYNGETIQRN